MFINHNNNNNNNKKALEVRVALHQTIRYVHIVEWARDVRLFVRIRALAFSARAACLCEIGRLRQTSLALA